MRFQKLCFGGDGHNFLDIAKRESYVYRGPRIDVHGDRAGHRLLKSSFFHAHLVATNFERADDKFTLRIARADELSSAFGVDNRDLRPGDDCTAWVFHHACETASVFLGDRATAGEDQYPQYPEERSKLAEVS